MTNEELAAAVQNGRRELMADLYEQNRRFIFAVVKHIGIQPEYYEDAMQDAYIGLDEAVTGYDTEKGCKFLTYAKPYIQNAIQRGQNNAVHVPEYVRTEARKIKYAHNELACELNRVPALSELSGRICVDEKSIQYMLQAVKPVISIYAPVDGTDDLTLADSIEDTSITFEEDITAADEARTVREVVGELPEAERNVIQLYYFHGLKYNDISERLNIPTEEVRRLAAKGLRLLRHPRMSRRLMYDEADRQAVFYRHRGLETFNTTWTSDVEQAAIVWERNREDDKC